MEGNKVKKCTCYTCTHDDPHERAAYYQGYIDACGWFLSWAKHNKIKRGSIAYNVLCDLNIKPLERIKALEKKDVK